MGTRSARVATNNSIFVVNAKVPAASLAQLVKFSESKPDSLSFLHDGRRQPESSQARDVRALVKAKHPEQRFELTPVPYNGLVPALSALRRGDVDACVLPYAASVKDLDAKEIRIISVQAAKRIRQIPQLQTTGEQGCPEMDQNESPVIFSVLKGTRPEVVRKLEVALKEPMQDPTVVKRLDDADLQPGFVGTAETTARINAVVARTIKTIREAKLNVVP
jgi:tripartite-type tricarboxylate transporter receptor subunit TctC